VQHDLTHLRLVIVPLKLEYKSLDGVAAGAARTTSRTTSARFGVHYRRHPAAAPRQSNA